MSNPVQGLLACGLVLVIGAAPFAASAQGDPLASPACRSALDALRREESAAPAASAPASALAAARREAGRACLAASADAASVPRSRQTSPPIVVPSTRLPGAVPSPRYEAAPPSVTPVRPPPTVTSCDAGGCWASDGTRVQRYGTELYGPRGRCTVQGGVLVCP